MSKVRFIHPCTCYLVKILTVNKFKSSITSSGFEFSVPSLKFSSRNRKNNVRVIEMDSSKFYCLSETMVRLYVQVGEAKKVCTESVME